MNYDFRSMRGHHTLSGFPLNFLLVLVIGVLVLISNNRQRVKGKP